MSSWGILGRPDGIENWSPRYVDRWRRLALKAADVSKMSKKKREQAEKDVEYERRSIITAANEEIKDGTVERATDKGGEV